MLINISIHDVTRSKLDEVKLLTHILKDFNIEKISYLVVPFYHEKEYIEDIIDFISTIKHQEIIIHGYTHKSKPFTKYDYRNIFTSHEAEFLLEDDLEKRINLGIEAFAKVGIYPKGFIAPAWLMRKEVFKLLKEKGFYFTTDRNHIYNLKEGFKIFSPVICFGSRGIIKDISIKTFKHQFNIIKYLNIVRIALHPTDAKDFRKLKIITAILKDLKDRNLKILDLYTISKAKNLIKN